jgi:hypothetical protein
VIVPHDIVLLNNLEMRAPVAETFDGPCVISRFLASGKSLLARGR